MDRRISGYVGQGSVKNSCGVIKCTSCFSFFNSLMLFDDLLKFGFDVKFLLENYLISKMLVNTSTCLTISATKM